MNATRVGTPLYLSPEVIRKEPYNFKIDQWAIGCVIYHLAALAPPFESDNIISLGYNICNKFQKSLPKQYSKKLKDFVWEFLSKDPKNRPDMKIIDIKFPPQVMSYIIQGIGKNRYRPSTAVSYKQRKLENEQRKEKIKNLEKLDRQ
jgi:serine/threonine protein kinase